ncbi:hypothetical protein RvY_18917 [Ramazzottius varieornatus]|uniref:Uncharacterized protein n=1 Tax=Ramazzottius varieornatus TaxID=947166 RepID=A0A1D1WBB2_RAMVA|nr:hypothetical protein RvY_18917 [Ramazzottius varieornatus]
MFEGGAKWVVQNRKFLQEEQKKMTALRKPPRLALGRYFNDKIINSLQLVCWPRPGRSVISTPVATESHPSGAGQIAACLNGVLFCKTSAKKFYADKQYKVLCMVVVGLLGLLAHHAHHVSFNFLNGSP